MTTAIPVWGAEISPVFDFARRIMIVESDQGREITRFSYELRKKSMSSRVERLSELGVNVLICGAISNPLAKMVTGSGINLISWKCGPVDQILTAFFSGSLQDPRFLMPGCRDRGIGQQGTFYKKEACLRKHSGCIILGRGLPGNHRSCRFAHRGAQAERFHA